MRSIWYKCEVETLKIWILVANWFVFCKQRDATATGNVCDSQFCQLFWIHWKHPTHLLRIICSVADYWNPRSWNSILKLLCSSWCHNTRNSAEFTQNSSQRLKYFPTIFSQSWQFSARIYLLHPTHLATQHKTLDKTPY